jgi:hypothetical protein
MPETKVCPEPGHHGARFHARLEHAALRGTLIRRELTEVRVGFAGFRFDVVEVGLK